MRFQTPNGRDNEPADYEGHERRVGQLELRDRILTVEVELRAHMENESESLDKLTTQVDWCVDSMAGFTREWKRWKRYGQTLYMAIGAIAGQLLVWIGQAIWEHYRGQFLP